MSDRYLYRAKRTDNWEWVEGYYVFCRRRHYILPICGKCGFDEREDYWTEIDPSTICQCVGLPDKNGKYLYEKDIIKSKDGSMGIVTFGVFGTNNIGFSVKWFYGQHYRHEIGYWASKVEVIGNTIDNPELLEVGE